jgi:hypothetical protein
MIRRPPPRVVDAQTGGEDMDPETQTGQVDVDVPGARHPSSVPKSPTATAPPRRPWLYSSWTVLLAVIVVFNLLYALPRYLQFNPAISRSTLDPSFPLHFPVLVAHIVTGNIALVTVLINLMPWIRRRYPAIHRVNGRVYVFAGALPAALLSLVLLPYSTAPMGKLGLLLMAVLWITTTSVGFWMAWHHRYLAHRRWMIYSFALALGTSWGRVIAYVAVPGKDIDLAIFFDISSWMGWVCSLIVAHWYVERTQRQAARTLRALGSL